MQQYQSTSNKKASEIKKVPFLYSALVSSALNWSI